MSLSENLKSFWRYARIPVIFLISLIRISGLILGVSAIVAGIAVYQLTKNNLGPDSLLKRFPGMELPEHQQPLSELPSQILLHVPLSGYLVERLTEQERFRAQLRQASGDRSSIPNTPTHDLIEVLEQAAKDSRVQAVLLDLSSFFGGSAALLNELVDAMDSFRADGKKIIAYGAFMGQGGYFLASRADTRLLDPEGGVYLSGYGVHALFFADTLKKLKVNVHAFVSGNYKSAPEVFTSDRMSDYAKEAARRWAGELWTHWKDRAAHSGASALELQSYADSLDDYILNARGNWAQAALNRRLVDGIRPVATMEVQDLANFYLAVQQEFWSAETDAQPAESEESATAQELMSPAENIYPVGWRDYHALAHGSEQLGDRSNILVLFAEGAVAFEDDDGSFDAFRIARELRSASRSPNPPKAIVLRVNSPGGSVAASEVVRRAIRQVQDIPVIVSFGGVGASGAYYLATAADQIWAGQTTVTGSIGVFSLLFTLEEAAKWAGLSYDGVGTSRLSGIGSITEPLHPALSSIIDSRTDFTYRTFKQLVAASRKMTASEVERIAQGQVWTGAEALAHNLLDGTGGLNAAVAAAAKAAGLAEGEYQKVYLMKAFNFWEVLSPILPFLRNNDTLLSRLASLLPASDTLAPAAAWAPKGLSRFFKTPDPQHLYAECLECSSAFPAASPPATAREALLNQRPHRH